MSLRRRHRGAGAGGVAAEGGAQDRPDHSKLISHHLPDAVSSSLATMPLSDAGDIVAPEQQGLLLKVVPETDRHTVELHWAVPPEVKAYRAQPCGYLSHLLG